LLEKLEVVADVVDAAEAEERGPEMDEVASEEFPDELEISLGTEDTFVGSAGTTSGIDEEGGGEKGGISIFPESLFIERKEEMSEKKILVKMRNIKIGIP
jgi:hypothetical protein